MKILVVRFSSIGDIVLTSPVVRCLKQQLPNVEIHFLTKNRFVDLVAHNPHIHKVWGMESNIAELIPDLKAQKFDQVIDLHHNLRTAQLKRALKVNSSAFKKLNFQKWWLVTFKHNKLPEIHIVQRYLDTVDFLGIKNDGKGLDFFYPPTAEIDLNTLHLQPKNYLAVAIGAQFATKTLPTEKLIEVLLKIDFPIVLLGGKEDQEKAHEIASALSEKNIHSLCGKCTLLESAFVIDNAKAILTYDTGLMHIAAAFDIPIVSIWGNTVPELGMYPYSPNNNYTIHQVENLTCRPCSKIGYQKCPKGHFKCMNDQNVSAITSDIKNKLK